MKCRNCHRDIPDNSMFCNWCGHAHFRKKKETITVPVPKQLPSGSWRIYLRREGISITRPTPERCIRDAMTARKLWLEAEADGRHNIPEPVVTLGEIIDQYIDARRATRAPMTITGYESIRNNRFQSHMDDNVRELDTQEIVDDEIDLGLGPKTIHNAWGLCSSALKYAKIPFDEPSLPRMTKSKRNWLTYKQIVTFLDAIRGQRCELGALLALHSLRRSEIFGLRPQDYDAEDQVLHVCGAYHNTADGWIRTDLNKTDKSTRDVPILIPRLKELLDLVDTKKEFIIGRSYTHLYDDVNKICEQAGLPEVGLHGLRHSFASLAYHLGWKKLSTMEIGGWSNSKVLDEIYTHNADLEDDLETMRDFFRV